MITFALKNILSGVQRNRADPQVQNQQTETSSSDRLYPSHIAASSEHKFSFHLCISTKNEAKDTALFADFECIRYSRYRCGVGCNCIPQPTPSLPNQIFDRIPPTIFKVGKSTRDFFRSLTELLDRRGLSSPLLGKVNLFRQLTHAVRKPPDDRSADEDGSRP